MGVQVGQQKWLTQERVKGVELLGPHVNTNGTCHLFHCFLSPVPSTKIQVRASFVRHNLHLFGGQALPPCQKVK